MKKIGICGHFGIGKELKNGQTIKTINIYKELCKSIGEDNISILDTCDWKKNPIKFVFNCIKIMKKSQNLIILPAQNGLKVFVPIFACLKKLYKTNLIYAVVGGWLPEFIENTPFLIKCLKKFDIILVETDSMKEKLKRIELNNVDILLNFKNIEIIKELNYVKTKDKPLKCCTFSRVIKEKGIENAINAVTIVNKECKTKCVLDIYGPVSEEYKDAFDEILNNSKKEFISYKGIVPAEQSANTIKEYDLLLFPTYYQGEGLAGTVIDAFSSGVPVVASDWRYNCDIIQHGVNGFIFETKNDIELAKILKDISLGKYDISNMKKNCLTEAKKYIPEVAIKGLIKYIV